MKKRVLINASNCKKGGTAQVATSFINELRHYDDFFKEKEIHLYVSGAVNANLQSLNCDLSFASNYKIFDMNVLKIFSFNYFSYFNRGFDLVFNFFGPQYILSIGSHRNDGFADVSMISKEVRKNSSFTESFKKN